MIVAFLGHTHLPFEWEIQVKSGKLGNFSRGFYFCEKLTSVKLDVKFCENKTIAKWLNHSVIC